MIEDKQEVEKQINQNKWIYTQMKRQYYWTDDMPDSLSLDYDQASPQFFNKIKSIKDRFSWIEANSSYGGESMFDKFGFDFQEYILPNGKIVNRILFVDNNSPARQAGLKRGMWFTASETSKSQSSLTMNIGSFKNNVFIAAETITVPESSTRASAHTSAILLDSIYIISGRKIGYFVYNQFEDTGGNVSNIYRQELRDMFQRFKDNQIEDLIIDIRYNPGGYVSICQYLCSLILPDEVLGQISGYHEFNKTLALEQYIKTGNREEVLFFPSKNDVFQKNIGLNKIYTIISKKSFSASESLINSLEPYITVKKIGSKSGGKGVGSWTIRDNNYSYQLNPITFRYYNSAHGTVPDDGLTPDIYVNETTSITLFELGDIRELLLSTALDDIFGLTRSKSTYETERISITPIFYNEEHRRVSGYKMDN